MKIEGAALALAHEVELKNVAKKFGKIEILNNINFSISKGETVSLIGPSGSGKSTLLRLIAGLEPITSGEIKHTEGGQLGMVFQHFYLFPHLNLIDNLMLTPKVLKRGSKDSIHHQAQTLLKKVGLENHHKHYPSELSGGQQQRGAIARALMMNPSVMLYDEPTSALDPSLVREVIQVIKNLTLDGMTSLIVTHEMKLARDVSHRVLFLSQGNIIESGKPDLLFTRPQSNELKLFLDEVSEA